MEKIVMFAMIILACNANMDYTEEIQLTLKAALAVDKIVNNAILKIHLVKSVNQQIIRIILYQLIAYLVEQIAFHVMLMVAPNAKQVIILN